MTAEAIINECQVEGNHIKLPAIQLDRTTYMEVAKKLQKIGGKWTGGKVQAFVFPYNPSELLADLQEGKDRNIKKEFQFFETPQALAKQLVELAEIPMYAVVLEPSGGRGAIIRRIHPSCSIYTYETNELFYDDLLAIHNCDLLGKDFLEADESGSFPRIVANPPFSKNQDIDHIRKMYAVLMDGGVMVSVASKHWQTSLNTKEREFRNWLVTVGAEIIDVPAETFKESGTNIATVIIKIRK